MNKPIVAMPFRHHASHVCAEARKMLTDAGFSLVCNNTGEKLTPEEQHRMIREAYAVIAGTERYDDAMLEGCDNLRVIMRFGVGTDNFDLEAMKRRGIAVGVIANYNAVAEFTLTLMLSALKSYPRLDREVRAGGWGRFPMRELTGKTVGLVGFGRIGRRLAELLGGFGVTLLVYDPYVDAETVRQHGGEKVALEVLLGRSDVVSLHLPSTPETHRLMNAERFALMKDGAYLVNTARGALVDEAALVAALQSGKLAGAGLDVYETEPVTPDNPLFSLANTALAPHCSAITYETNYNGGLICAESILRVRNGGKPVYSLF